MWSHPDARLELREAADFYDLERPGLGSEFLDEVERTIKRIVAHPESSPVVLGHVRRCLISRFPFSVIYSLRDGAIRVSAFAHTSRRPFYWRERI